MLSKRLVVCVYGNNKIKGCSQTFCGFGLAGGKTNPPNGLSVVQDIRYGTWRVPLAELLRIADISIGNI